MYNAPAVRFIAYDLPGDDDGSRRRERALESISHDLLNQIKEAVEWRKRTGIEDRWRQDLAFYEGRDDDETPSGSITKDEIESGRIVGDDDTGGVKSRIFLNVIKPYTDNAASRVMDFISPSDDRPWEIEPTPIPELAQLTKGQIPTYIDEEIENTVNQENPDANPEEKQLAVDNTRLQIRRDAELIYRRADQAAQRAQRTIDDWLVESNFDAELRDCADDFCQSGTAVMKGPVPMLAKGVKLVKGRLEIFERMVPMSMRVDYMNCYPDPAGKENPHNGEFHWEKDEMTRHRLRQLAEDPHYFSEQIAKCLREGPMNLADIGTGDNPRGDGETKKRLFDVWTGYCFLGAEELNAIGARMHEKEEDPDEHGLRSNLMRYLEEIAVRAVMINGRVVQITPNPSHEGAFPYDYMVWSRRVGMPFGDGIPRLGRDPQRIIVGASRMMMNNAGVAAGPMLVIDMDKLAPEDGQWEFRAFKVWKAKGDLEDVRNAFTTIDIDMGAKDLQSIIYLGLKFMEDVTGQPVLLQGQSGEHSPDTVGGMRLLNDNASAPMRRVARLIDDRFIEPHIKRYYAYLLTHGDGRGGDYSHADLRVKAKGSAALVQRDTETQNIIGLLEMSLNPAFGLDPRKVMLAVIRGMHLNSKDYVYDDKQWEQIMVELSKPKPDSALQVAHVRAEVDQMKAELQAQIKREGLQTDLLIEHMRRQSGDMETRVSALKDEMSSEMDRYKLSQDQRQFFEKLFAELQSRIADRESQFGQFLIGEQTKLQLQKMKNETEIEKAKMKPKPSGGGDKK